MPACVSAESFSAGRDFPVPAQQPRRHSAARGVQSAWPARGASIQAQIGLAQAALGAQGVASGQVVAERQWAAQFQGRIDRAGEAGDGGSGQGDAGPLYAQHPALQAGRQREISPAHPARGVQAQVAQAAPQRAAHTSNRAQQGAQVRRAEGAAQGPICARPLTGPHIQIQARHRARQSDLARIQPAHGAQGHAAPVVAS